MGRPRTAWPERASRRSRGRRLDWARRGLLPARRQMYREGIWLTVLDLPSFQGSGVRGVHARHERWTPTRWTQNGRHPDKALSAAFVRTADEARPVLRWARPLPVGASERRPLLGAAPHDRRPRPRTRAGGLGGFPLVSRAEARETAFANRKLARSGADPLADKQRRYLVALVHDVDEVSG